MDYESAAIELMRIHAQFNRLKANQQMDGMSQGELFALGYIYEKGKAAYPKDISDGMAVSSARVAAILNHMEEKGWICRETDCNDCRKKLVRLTDAGEEIYLIKKKETLDSVVKILQDLGEKDTTDLLRIRKKMLEG